MTPVPESVEEAVEALKGLRSAAAFDPEDVRISQDEKDLCAKAQRGIDTALAALAQGPKEEGGHTVVADNHGLAPDVAAPFSDQVVERMARDSSADADLAAALLEGLEALANTPMNIDLSVWSRFAFNVQNVAKRLRAAKAAQPPSLTFSDKQVERAAMAIYADHHFVGPTIGEKPPWRLRGNSFKQDEARALAQAALSALEPN